MEREFIDIPIQEISQATKEEAKFMWLLNDYLLKYYAEYWNRNLYCELGGWSLLNVHEIVIISKKFWFIQRLVDHDRIDLDKLLKGIKENKIYCWKWWKTRNMLLMLLAVSNSPIKDLISYLK